MPTSRLHTILSALIIAIALCASWLTQHYHFAIDLTANQRHSLSSTTTHILTSMEYPMEIVAVVGSDPQTRSAIDALIDRMQAIKPDISLRYVDPQRDPATARALNAAPGGELILRLNDREQRLQSISERQISNSLRLLQRGEERQIAFITGHQERSPTSVGNDDWNIVTSRLQKLGFNSVEVSLVSKPYLDDSFHLVVIAAPETPYFPGEIASIKDYLSRGGNLLWMQEPESHGLGDSLSLLQDELGIDFLPGVVIDTASQVLAANSADFVLLDQFPLHEVTQVLSAPLLLPQASALAVTPLAGQTTLPLLQTPEASWTETGPLVGELKFDSQLAEVAGPLMLGVTVERTSINNSIQRMAVIGDADFGSSQFIDNGSNQTFIEALLLWLTDDSKELSFVTTAASDDYLNLSNRSIVALSVLCLAITPLTFLSIGFVVHWRRRRA